MKKNGNEKYPFCNFKAVSAISAVTILASSI